MSEAVLRLFKASFFSNPTSAPDLTVINPLAVLLTPGSPVELVGAKQLITTTANTSATPVQLVVNGANNQVNLGFGAAVVNVIGGGAIVECIQLLDSFGQPIPDAGKQIKLGDSTIPYNGATVDLTATVAGDFGAPESITQAAGGIAAPTGGFAYYTHGGTGNDSILGSTLNDFIRGGAGDDFISAGDGNDLVRGGTGNDSVFLGLGNDTLYYSLDQVGGANADTVGDFLSGTDKIVVQAGITSAISADGKTVTFTAGAQTTTLFNQAGTFASSDIINFVA